MDATPVDLENVQGETISDQDGRKIGKIKDVCGKDGDGEPMWISVDASFGLMLKRVVILPVARLKEEDDEILVPYSLQHVRDSPEVEPSDEFSAEDDRRLRDHYGIDRADQELRTDNESYASRVVEGPGSPPEEAFEVDKEAADKEFEKDKDSDEDTSDEDSAEDDSEDEEADPRASEKAHDEKKSRDEDE
jgi:hypothetical protein